MLRASYGALSSPKRPSGRSIQPELEPRRGQRTDTRLERNSFHFASVVHTYVHMYMCVFVYHANEISFMFRWMHKFALWVLGGITSRFTPAFSEKKKFDTCAQKDLHVVYCWIYMYITLRKYISAINIYMYLEESLASKGTSSLTISICLDSMQMMSRLWHYPTTWSSSRIPHLSTSFAFHLNYRECGPQLVTLVTLSQLAGHASWQPTSPTAAAIHSWVWEKLQLT